MASFDAYAPLLKLCEGGWSDRKDDKGGATMMGVTLSTFRSWYGKDKTKYDLRNITYDQWKQIMKSGYWDKVKADQIANQSVAEIIADWAINSGVKTASKKVQRILGVAADGIIGKVSLSAINSASQEALHRSIKLAREDHFRAIVKSDPGQRVNLNGWMNRLARFIFKP